MQQADGWQNPETHTDRIEIGLDAGSRLGYASERPSGSLSGYLPWLEIVAPRDPRRSDQGFIGSGLMQQFRQPSMAENLAALIHDARNMVAAMDLYCDLLQEPGVLSAPFSHYAGELRLVSGASRRLLEKLAVLDRATDFGTKDLALSSTNLPLLSRINDTIRGRISDSISDNTDGHLHSAIPSTVSNSIPRSAQGSHPRSRPAWFFQFGEPIQDFAADLLANQNLLSAIAESGVAVALSVSGGHRPIAMASDDLTRVLVNLCRNAVEVMPTGGHIQIALEESPESLMLTFADEGPGIPESALDAIFSSGFTSHHGNRCGESVSATGAEPTVWPTQHRGLGLAIVRSIVSAAGGSVWAANRNSNPEAGGTAQSGAIISLEFPLFPCVP
jgi:signal transduction histidine kinase